MDEEQRRRLQQGDATARQLFGGINQFPSFGSVVRAAQGLQNAVPSVPALAASTIDSVRGAVASTPLIGRSRMGEGTATSLPQFPSGTVGGGFDIYPTVPQMAPTSGFNQWAATPFRGTQRTQEQIASDEAYLNRRSPQISSAMDRLNMAPQSLSVVEAARGNAGAINAQYSPVLPQTTLSNYSIPNFPATQLGIAMGSQIAEANRPSFQQQSMAGGPQPSQQLTPINQQVPVQLKAIQVPQGTVYARSEAPRGQMTQAESFASRPTAFEGRTPQQQQALIAQMRQRGADVMAKNIAEREKFMAQQRIENARTPYSPTPTTLAGIQRQFGEFRGLGNRTPTQYAEERGFGNSVFSTTPFAQSRARESVSGFSSGMAPRLSQQILTAMREPRSRREIAGIGGGFSFSNYG